MLIDTHCHLDLPPLFEQLDELLAEARAVGVAKWVVPSVHPDGWQRIAELAAQHPALRPAYGIHPLHADNVTAQHLQLLRQLAPAGIAIGEIGLDASYGNLEQQEALFREQLRIARLYGLPVLIHCRKAIGRTVAILREERADQVGGIMHAFSGSLESARECIKLGFVLSLSATLTWSNAVRPLQLAAQLPLEQLVLETDAPDLPPSAHPGCPNRPAWLHETASRLAAIKGISVAEVACRTTATALRILPQL
ncbi:TatD family hydrolase [Trichlorobacter lovleyi]|uniref:TatD family hydrolase n=1 Tax=Trichlorobacter lovleyi TaxID=313985 RepID=UPI003D0F1CE8